MLSYNECIKKLVEIGQKNNSLLTFKQINEVLPNSPIYLDKIEEIISELVGNGIELIDETQKKLTKKKVSVKKTKTTKKFQNRRYYDDPVRMYLGEMGRVPLLDREGEIRIAKKIESGQKYINKFVFISGSTLREMDNFLHRYREKRVKIDHIFKIEYGTWMDKSQESTLINEFELVIKGTGAIFEELGEMLDDSDTLETIIEDEAGAGV